MPRISVNISDEMKKYYESVSRKTGVSQSALIALDLSKMFEERLKEVDRNEGSKKLY